MHFAPTAVNGVVVIDIEQLRDERGFFARAWCPSEFADAGLHVTWAQESVSFNLHRGTLRGLHLQRPPHAEVKLVRCTRGTVWDVAVDLRSASSTYGKSVGVELSADNYRSLYIPEGCAHGYLTLTDDVEMRYLISQPYVPQAAAGVRYDDPALDVSWPQEVLLLSEKDRSWPPFEPDSVSGRSEGAPSVGDAA